MLTTLLLGIFVITTTLALPSYDYNGYYMQPRRRIMVGGYYGHPLSRRNLMPQGSMTAIIAGDTVATNSFAGEQFADEEQEEEPEQQTPKNTISVPHEAVSNEEVPVEVPTTQKPKRIPKRRPQKPQPEEEDDESNYNSGWPFNAGKGGIPSYNAFFPIMIGGGSSGHRARSGNEESPFPGSATAIANSFSTGRGGVANSHATSFGDPYLASMLRNGMFNFRRSKPQQE